MTTPALQQLPIARSHVMDELVDVFRTAPSPRTTVLSVSDFRTWSSAVPCRADNAVPIRGIERQRVNSENGNQSNRSVRRDYCLRFCSCPFFELDPLP